MNYTSITTQPRSGSYLVYDKPTDPDYEMRVQYFNHTGKEIHLAQRNGLSVTLPSITVAGNNDFIIRVDFYFTDVIREQVIRHLNDVDEFSDDNLRYFAESIRNGGLQRLGHRYCLSVSYPVAKHHFSYANEGAIYLADLDVVLGWGDLKGKLLHPYSPEGRISGMFDTVDVLEDYALNMVAVDNEGNHPEVWFRYGVQVERIRSIVDKTRKSGVYLKSKNSNHTYWIDFSDDLLQYGIYFTYSDAFKLGDALLQEKQKEKLLKLESDNKEAALELAKAKLQNDKLLNEMKLQQAQFDSQLAKEKTDNEIRIAQLEREHQDNIRRIEIEERERKLDEFERKSRMSDYYERRSYERKDTNEWLKAIPTILVGIGSIFLAFKGLRTS